MKIPLLKKIWWLWRYHYLQKKAVYENTFIEDFPEPEPKKCNCFGSGSGSSQKGRLRLRLRNTEIMVNYSWKRGCGCPSQEFFKWLG